MAMRTTALLLLFVTTGALGQANREPKRLADAERDNDILVARRAFDASARAMLTPAFRNAIDHYTSGPSDLQSSWGEFVAADGTPFLALQLAPHDPVAMKAGERIIFFGQLTDANGKTLATFNEPQPVVVSNGDVFIERSLILPMRRMQATFGLARRNEIIGLTRVDMDPEPFTASGGGISRIITSSDVHVLATAQAPLDPFSFGGTKVVPKPGSAFRKSDEVWLFTELRNPSLGADGLPHVKTKVEIEGTVKSIPGTPVDAEATPLKGVPGHYGIGSTIDVRSLPPGDYTVRLILTDTTAKQSYQRSTVIHILP